MNLGLGPAAFDFVGDGEGGVEMSAAAAGGDEDVRPGWQLRPLVDQVTHDAAEPILESPPGGEWIPELDQVGLERGGIFPAKNDHACGSEIAAVVFVSVQMPGF